ncbi:MAG: sigma-54-dependent Fis family transcriptional regulator [Bacteroidota bacterium]|nr:sigma-54-dependent Fis family transcriptional regulator [Bacteroidota bacterium]
MEGYSIFIVEDDPFYGELLAYHLSLNPDYVVTRFETAKECLANLHKKPNLVTVDFSLPDMTGDELFKKIRGQSPSTAVIIISSQEEISVAVDLVKQGVDDYLVKDEATKDLLWNSIIRIRENQNLKQHVEELRSALGQKFNFRKTLIGQSPELEKVYQLMEKACSVNINVSISGETGTGKEVVAKAIHYQSERSRKNFVALNMASIPHELIESELFGHEKGAFTGAIARKAGKFEEANGGTLFLDEIAELDLGLQSKLLRVLQEREVVRIGGRDRIQLDVRIITATHKDLAEEVKKGTFREDLYFRIIGLPIHIPPLRERGNDVLLLAKYFADIFTKENNLPEVEILRDAKDKLMKYNFPGNVRELRAVIDLAALMCHDSQITAEDISFPESRKQDLLGWGEKPLREYTREIIRHYLHKYNEDVVETAKALDIGKSTIYKMLQTGELTI